MTRISVVMPVLDAAGTVAAALESIADQTRHVDEIVVAHGPSSDGTAGVLDALTTEDDRIQVIDNPTGGRSAGLNRAIAAATGDVIVRCDAHSEVPPDYVDRAVTLLTETGADVVGGVQHGVGTTPLGRAVALAQASPLGTGGSRYRTGSRGGEVDTVYLGVYRRTALDRVGGFDEDLIGNEDYDLHWRIRTSGGSVVLDPELHVSYRPRQRIRSVWRQYFRYGAWKRAMVRRHPRSVRLRQVVPQALVLGLVASVVVGAVAGWRWALPIPGTYAFLLCAESVRLVLASRDAAAVLTAPVMATMHLAWGLGFLVGSARTAR